MRRDTLGKLSEILRKPRLTFFVGAGISKDAPAGLPVGGEFAVELLKRTAGSDIRLRTPLEQLRLLALRGDPGCRLEVLLELARQGIGDEALRLVQVMDQGAPNAFHYTLARALRLGHHVVTTNFDNLIEQAYHALTGEEAVSVIRKQDVGTTSARGFGYLLKIHGSIREIGSVSALSTIRATLASFAQGLESWKYRLLKEVVSHRPVMFLGYSGGDTFDINPILPGILMHSEIVWSAYADTLLACQVVSSGTGHVLLRIASESGNPDSVFVVRGRTIDLIRMLPYFQAGPSIEASLASTDWRTPLGPALDALNVSAFMRTRYFGKLLQQNRLWREAQRCLNRNSRESRGINAAIAHDDLAQYFFYRRLPVEDLRLRRKARTLAKGNSTVEGRNLVARTWLGSGEAYRQMARYGLALRCFGRAQDMYQALGVPDKAGYALAGIGGIHRMQSRFTTSIGYYRRALALLRAGRDLPGILFVKWGIGEVYKCQGQLRSAGELYQEVMDKAVDMGQRTHAALATWGIAELRRIRGEFGFALDAYQAALSMFSPEDHSGMGWALEGICQCELALGTSPYPALDRARASFRRANAVYGLATCLLHEAAFASSIGRFAAAAQALAKFPDNLGQKERANCLLVKAVLHSRRGYRDAGRHVDAALRTYGGLGMRHAIVHATTIALSEVPTWRPNERRTRMIGTLHLARRAGFAYEEGVLRKLEAGISVKPSLILY